MTIVFLTGSDSHDRGSIFSAAQLRIELRYDLFRNCEVETQHSDGGKWHCDSRATFSNYADAVAYFDAQVSQLKASGHREVSGTDRLNGYPEQNTKATAEAGFAEIEWVTSLLAKIRELPLSNRELSLCQNAAIGLSSISDGRAVTWTQQGSLFESAFDQICAFDRAVKGLATLVIDRVLWYDKIVSRSARMAIDNLPVVASGKVTVFPARQRECSSWSLRSVLSFSGEAARCAHRLEKAGIYSIADLLTYSEEEACARAQATGGIWIKIKCRLSELGVSFDAPKSASKASPGAHRRIKRR